MSAAHDQWNVEDPGFWQAAGKRVAARNLCVSMPNLLCGFAVWILWSVIIVNMQQAHDADPRQFAFTAADGRPLAGDAYKALLYTLPAVAGLAGATLRIPNSFVVALSGGRTVNALTTLLLVLPALGTGIALRDPGTPFATFVVLAALSGVGGGAFASSMSNISFFFPKRVQGLALGLNAGIGNLGVSVMQLAVPYVVTFGMFGALGGEPCLTAKGPLWIQNAGLVWVPVLAAFALLAWLLMTNLPMHGGGRLAVAAGRFLWLEAAGLAASAAGVVLLVLLPLPELLKMLVVVPATVGAALLLMRYGTPGAARQGLVRQLAVLRNKHNWIMTWLYVMTFGSFIGYSCAFPKLITDVFGYVRVDSQGAPLAEPLKRDRAPNALAYAFLGPLVGSLVRPLGGWLSDRYGGARVTHWDTIVMVGAAAGVAWCIGAARASPAPESCFLPFLLLFLLLFVTTGIGNGSTFRMIPMIFPKEQAGPVLGWTSAIAAYGAFLIPTIFGNQIKAGTPEYAVYGFVAYYLSCLAVNWWYYARPDAEIKC